MTEEEKKALLQKYVDVCTKLGDMVITRDVAADAIKALTDEALNLRDDIKKTRGVKP